MGFVADVFKAIGSILSPILKIISIIPGIGQLAKIADTALTILSNLDKAFQDFPKGLIQVAAKAVKNLLPTPLDIVASVVAGAGGDSNEGLKELLPPGVKEFVPNLVKPIVPKAVQELVF